MSRPPGTHRIGPSAAAPPGEIADAVDGCEIAVGEAAAGADTGRGVLVGVGCKIKTGFAGGTGDALVGAVAVGEGPGRTICAEATRPRGWPARCDMPSPAAITATATVTMTNRMLVKNRRVARCDMATPGMTVLHNAGRASAVGDARSAGGAQS